MKQTNQEMQGLVTNEIDFLINEGEAMGYVYIAIKTKDSQDGMSKIHGASKLFAPPEMHQQMTKAIPLFKGLFNGMYNKVIVLHDPTIPMVESTDHDGTIKGEPFKTTGRLSDTKKEAIDKLMEEGKGTDDKGLNEIAKTVNVSFAKVKEYIKSF